MDQQLDKKITEFLDAHKDEMVADLQRLVRIASYKEAPAPGAPFGPGPTACMQDALKLCESYGMTTCDLDGYCGYAQWGESEEHIATLSHMDTVPIGDGWIHDPLGGAYENGLVYGRGSSDDKAGAIGSLYAVRALMNAGFVPKMAIRLIFGCDEESGMGDMPYYLAREKAPKYAFSPDAGFPLCYAEKGRLEGRVEARFTAPSAIVKIEGGVAANVVPADATAWLKGYKAADLPESAYIDFHDEEDLVVVHASGISCHGGAPHGGRNADALLLNYLARVLPAADGAYDALNSYASLIGMHLDGKGMGIDCTDDIAGALTMNIGVLGGGEDHLWFIFDIRHPVTLDASATAERMKEIFAANGWTVPYLSVSNPLYVPLDNPLITTLMGVYQQITGDMTPPGAMGGGTYARTLPCAVSFGHSAGANGHTYEENVNMDQLMKATRIYAHALAQLSNLEG